MSPLDSPLHGPSIRVLHAAARVFLAPAIVLAAACAPLGWFSSDAPASAHTESRELAEETTGAEAASARSAAEPGHAVAHEAAARRDADARIESGDAALGTATAPRPATAPDATRDEPRETAAREPERHDVARTPTAAPRELVDGGDASLGALAAEYEDGPAPTGDLRIERGPDQVPLLIPRGEELLFEVEIDLGPLGDPTVGRVTLSSGADPYFEGLPAARAGAKKTKLEAGWIKSRAQGRHLSYELDHELYVRHNPQVMPSIFLQDTQRGSENRRRKLKIGVQDGVLTAIHEHDGHCKSCTNPEHFVESKWLFGKPYHCEKCKLMAHRVWKPPQSRPVPQGALDMLSAVYLARSLIRTGAERTEFPLVDKQKLWNVELQRGKRKIVRVPAGRFDCVEVRLKTSRPASEPSDDEGFQGLFGIQGTIQIWFDAATGVPVLISGTLPVPILGDLDVRVQLKKATGAPAGFKPIE